ncbi:MAG: hypothetical protein ACRBFS_10135 [Aureispira sp.]
MTTKKTTIDKGEFDKTTTLLLQFLVLALLWGRAWQGLFWDLPLRTLFWDQSWLEGVVTSLTQDTWQHYVTNVSLPTDQLIDGLGVGLGVFWAMAGCGVFFLKNYPRFGQWIWRCSTITLLFVAFLYFKNSYWQIGQLLEYAAQIAAPLLLGYIWYEGKNTTGFRTIVKIIIAITFCSHGLYALGYYPQPGTWIEWCRNVFGFEGDASVRYFLLIVGILDWLAALCLFMPYKWLYKPALLYCIIWGFMTSFARFLGNFYSDMILVSLHQHLYEVAYRLVHGGLPLLLWFWIAQTSEE